MHQAMHAEGIESTIILGHLNLEITEGNLLMTRSNVP